MKIIHSSIIAIIIVIFVIHIIIITTVLQTFPPLAAFEIEVVFYLDAAGFKAPLK
jgi:uncharacterized membrane protein YesL